MNTHIFRRFFWIVATCLVLTALAAITLVVAQQSGADTEPGSARSLNESIATYDSDTSTGLPPDENRPPGSPRSPDAPHLTFSYYQVSGTTLRGRSSVTEYAYDGSGCTHVTSGSGVNRILNTELSLPDGAVIKYLRVYYKDTSTTNGVEGYITRYRPGQATTDLVHTGSTNAFSGGYGYVVSSEITETVSNSIYAYTLIGWPDAASSANQICGLRVAYYSPNVVTFLPLLTK